ncbi:hypothetical protein [Spiroplasma endosymbiont of Eupeodes luniger]|uniref:hypothetical protein n=1 Tax=Spiroplasma endosymbiont of Eupeodes luniger TaxID=3066300 RepID=UPI0030D512F7
MKIIDFINNCNKNSAVKTVEGNKQIRIDYQNIHSYSFYILKENNKINCIHKIKEITRLIQKLKEKEKNEELPTELINFRNNLFHEKIILAKDYKIYKQLINGNKK